MARQRRGRGEGGVYRRGDGRWAGMLDLGWDNGRRIRKFVYAATRRECVEKLAQLQRRVDSGQAAPNNRLTVGEYLTTWLEFTLPGTVRPSTEASYRDLVSRHIIPSIGKIRMEKLTPTDVRALLRAKSVEVSARGRPLSPRTVQYIHSVLRRALEQARRDELLVRNVAALVTPPRGVSKEVQPLTPEDARKLLHATRDDRLYPLYAVAVALGLRRGEALALRWEDVDLENRTLRVAGTLQRVNGQLSISEPKTARSRRVIPLPQVCVDALTAHRARQCEERHAAAVWPHPELVFTTSVGTPIEPRNLVRHFQQTCERTGIGKYRFHDLRHTCASLLLAQGVEPRVIMDTLGHSVISTTLNLYTHVMPATQREAANRMDEMLRSRTDES